MQTLHSQALQRGRHRQAREPREVATRLLYGLSYVGQAKQSQTCGVVQLSEVWQARSARCLHRLQEENSTMNNIVIAGKIVARDATKKDVGAGSVISFSVSDSKKVKGEWQNTYFDVSLWGSRDGVLPYLVKGATVVVTGELAPPVIKGEKCYLQVRAHDVALMGRTEPAASEDNPF